LLLGRLCGWRMLYLDDDLRGLRLEQVRAAAAALDRHAVVGIRVVGFHDNSVVRHAYRLAGGNQDSYLGSTFMLDASTETSFFPPVYNEDWLFFALLAAAGRVAAAGTVSQLAYDPFVHTRAFHEEFGDIFAEGIIYLLLEK